ncbi:MAG: hypothetical protein ACK4L4_07145 [Gemmobacter sp.]
MRGPRHLAAAAIAAVLATPLLAAPVLPDAVGRIEGGPNDHCTGALVAPDQVLALGSCLIGPLRGAPDGEKLRFRAGATAEGEVADVAGARLILHPSHLAGPGFYRGYFADAALLVLMAPVAGVDPDVLRGGTALSGRELPDRIGIVRP